MKIIDPYSHHAVKQPDRPAIVTDDKIIYYHEWEKIVRQTAAAFSNEPAVHNRVAIFLPNGHLFLQVFAGASAAGWANVVGDMKWSKSEVEARLNEVEPDIIVADESMKDVFQNQDAKIIFSGEISEWVHTHNDWQPDEKANAPFYIGFTSGSTGQPKAFVRSHQSWVESFKCNQIDLGMTAEDHVLIPGSFVNSIFIYGALSTLYIGGTVYVLNKFSTSRLMNVLKNNPISVIYVVPTMIHALINDGWKGVQQLTFISTGAKLLPSVKNEMKGHFPHASIYEFYGASELSFITVLKDDNQMTYADSVGQAFHNVEIKICGDDGKEVPPGETGVLYVRSKMLFDGYINNQGETDNVLDGDWATVHDIAKKDENDFIYILGRKNDMILYGGINIYPQEIEEVLNRVDSVEEVVVFGAKDAYWGEKVAAYIKGDVTIRELKKHCRDHLSSYKIPRIWRKVDRFPYTSGGKISRTEVKNWLEEGKHEKSRDR